MNYYLFDVKIRKNKEIFTLYEMKKEKEFVDYRNYLNIRERNINESNIDTIERILDCFYVNN